LCAVFRKRLFVWKTMPSQQDRCFLFFVLQGVSHVEVPHHLASPSSPHYLQAARRADGEPPTIGNRTSGRQLCRRRSSTPSFHDNSSGGECRKAGRYHSCEAGSL